MCSHLKPGQTGPLTRQHQSLWPALPAKTTEKKSQIPPSLLQIYPEFSFNINMSETLACLARFLHILLQSKSADPAGFWGGGATKSALSRLQKRGLVK